VRAVRPAREGLARAQAKPSSAPGMGAEQKVSRCSIRAEASPSRTLTEGTHANDKGTYPEHRVSRCGANVAACPRGGVQWKSEGAVRNQAKAKRRKAGCSWGKLAALSDAQFPSDELR